MRYEYEDQPPIRLNERRLMIELTLAIIALAVLPPLLRAIHRWWLG